MQEVSKNNPNTVGRQRNAGKHTYRWTYPVKVHKDGEDGCLFMSEKDEREQEEKQTKIQRGETREQQQHVIRL